MQTLLRLRCTLICPPHYVRGRPAIGKYLPLYQSTVFTSNSMVDVWANKVQKERYLQLLPAHLYSEVGMMIIRFLCTKLEYNPETETLRIESLRANGFVSQEFRMDNMIPYSYRDMMSTSNFVDPKLPPWVDDVMFYRNQMTQEIFFYEDDGKWNEETIKHPKLSVEHLFDERKWMDHYLFD